MSYQDETRRLASHADTQVRSLFAAYEAGTMTEDEFKEATIAVMLVAMATANQLADQALAQLLTRQTGTMVMPIGTVSHDASGQLAKALDTILAKPDSAPSLSRLAKAETLRSAQLGWGTALRQQPGVTGWTRQTRAGACDICERLAGDVLPLHVGIWHHPACNCVQKPVLA